MKIRLADRWDTECLVTLMHHYRDQSILKCHADTDEASTRQIIANVLGGLGFIFVAESQGEIIGMLMAIRNPNVWDHSVVCVNELAYWVEPEHRGGRAGYALLKRYQEFCQQLIDMKKISYYTITKMANSPDLDYGRFGFEKLEETWICQPV
jgi:GNAT superfamily N-acetyltransferase